MADYKQITELPVAGQALDTALTYIRTADGTDSQITAANFRAPCLQVANHLSELSGNAAQARQNLGLGNAANATIGTASGQLVALDSTGKIPAALLPPATSPGALIDTNNLSDIASAAIARTNLGIGTIATHADSDYFLALNGFSEIASNPTVLASARTNLGLKSAALQDAGTAAGNLVQLDTNAKIPQALIDFPQEIDPASLKKTSNLSDLTDVAAARTNLGITDAADPATLAGNGLLYATGKYKVNIDGTTISLNANGQLVASGGSSSYTETDPLSLHIASNLSDLNSVSLARTNLGLKSAAILDVGTSANNIVQLDSTGKILSSVIPTLAYLSKLKDDTTPILGGNLDTAGFSIASSSATTPQVPITNALLKASSEPHSVLGSVSGSISLNGQAYSYFSLTQTASATYTLSAPAYVDATRAFGITLRRTTSATQSTVWTNVKWSGGAAPTFTANGTDMIVFLTLDGGSTWIGSLVNKDVR